MLALKRVVLCVVIAHASSGCAVLTMRSPKSDDPSVTPRCSESRGGAVVDGLFTALYGVAGVALLANGESGASLPFLALGTAHTASAVAGVRSARRCSKAYKTHDEWLAREKTRSRGMPRTTDESTGTLGGRCYRNLTCNQGLSCERRTRICVPATETPAGGAPPSPEDAAPAGEPPINATTASEPPASEPPASKPPASEPPASEPPVTKPPAHPAPAPSVDGINWSDFWREVNL